ncbi:signal peptidase II [Solihabitans fulvus]|uniref:Lipoprotein signal peptidase n=1 Tax=Solihabitans fulvus TaxID=1892852 RepID=A0A5B2X5P9_9PSEU|nr:signal peptidase II [Solihabitans fulvus]KAA2258677.1 signal peptidase II [Solihabitans fulvus]
MSTEPSTEPTEAVVPSQQPRRRLGLLAVAAVAALGLDLLTKTLVVANLEHTAPVKLLGGLVYFSVLRNGGAAWGIASGMTWVLAIVAVGVVCTIIWLAPRLRSVGWALGLGLVLGGALGNLTDRIFRAPSPFQGHVVDFISVFAPYGDKFPVFNAADSAICVGGALIVLMALLQRDYDGTSTKNKSKAKSDSSAANDKKNEDETA